MTHVDRMAAIRAREAAATPGDWVASERRLTRCVAIYSTSACGVKNCAKNICSKTHNGNNDHSIAIKDLDFIAHARSDIPYLLERVEALEAALGEAIDTLDSVADAITSTHGDDASYRQGYADIARMTHNRLTAIKEGRDE